MDAVPVFPESGVTDGLLLTVSAGDGVGGRVEEMEGVGVGFCEGEVVAEGVGEGVTDGFCEGEVVAEGVGVGVGVKDGVAEGVGVGVIRVHIDPPAPLGTHISDTVGVGVADAEGEGVGVGEGEGQVGL
jgi:hypothetical protein